MRPSFVFLLLYISCSLSAQNDRMFAAGPGINGFGLAASLKLYKPVDNVSQLTKGDLLFELGNIQSRREVALINNALQSSGLCVPIICFAKTSSLGPIANPLR
jgi:hypothetical protein